MSKRQKPKKLQKIRYHRYKGKQLVTWPRVVLALALAAVLCFAVLLGQVLGGARDDIDGDPQVMVVLGCQVREDGPSVLLRDRLDKALTYLEGHPDMTVVVSGGQGAKEPTSEAQAMADYLIQRGISQERIVQEPQSVNTYQNLTYAAKHLKEAGVDITGGVILVSNGFHLARAKMLAGRAGFENVSTLSAPSSHVPTRLRMYIREPLALVKSFVFDR